MGFWGSTFSRVDSACTPVLSETYTQYSLLVVTKDYEEFL